jgi:oxygen-independent coproporphyrinogen-3 oxidase
MNNLSFYVHIPYCVKRCGYCDFNTYTPTELSIGSELSQVSRSYLDLVVAEIGYARTVTGDRSIPTLFFGGGTPTLMEPHDLGRVITAIADNFDLPNDAEITIEANPDSVSLEKLTQLREIGFNRISFGMQSSVPHVLAALDRTHDPENVARAVRWARESGFEEINCDLIYGAPGESIEDWESSVDTVLSLPITHVSAYALIVEDGTKLGNQVKRGEVTMPDDDETADKYLLVDAKLEAAGLRWYELSNWAKPGSESRHNMGYWTGVDWWGAGPGAHSHVGGRRFWNVKHPNAYAERILATGDPMQAEEFLDLSQKWTEELMLRIRLSEGIEFSFFTPSQLAVVEGFLLLGFVLQDSWADQRVVLSRTGRLLADRIVREIAM